MRNFVCQGMPIGLMISFQSWFLKQIAQTLWNTKDSLDAITKAFKTEKKALSLRVYHRTAFSRLAIYDGYIPVRMSVIVAKCIKGQTTTEYARQFRFFDRFDNTLTNSRELRSIKPKLLKNYELTKSYNLHRHYVTFIKDHLNTVQSYCDLIARTLKVFPEDSGNILIELPTHCKDFLVNQKCIKPYEENRRSWRNQQSLLTGRKLSIAFIEVHDKEEDAIKAMEYAIKGDKLRAIPLSIGDDESLENYQSSEHQRFWGLCKYACEILNKKENADSRLLQENAIPEIV